MNRPVELACRFGRCFNGVVRRFLAISLLVVFGLPLVSPMFALGAIGASLPACCRRAGKHQCEMSAEARAVLSQHGPMFGAQVERCPYCPASVGVRTGDTLAAPVGQAVYAALVAHPAGVVQTESKLRVSLGRSRQKRGPPVISL